MDKLIFEDLIPKNRQEFVAKVREISAKLDIGPDWLMFMMHNESGLDSTIINPRGGATGLIQFMPATAKALGTSSQLLREMSNVEQLDYVYKYFKPYSGKIKSCYDLYSICFMPIIIGKPDSWVLKTKKLSAETIAKYNSAFDLDHNNQITVGEWRQYLTKRFKKYNFDPYKK